MKVKYAVKYNTVFESQNQILCVRSLRVCVCMCLLLVLRLFVFFNSFWNQNEILKGHNILITVTLWQLCIS